VEKGDGETIPVHAKDVNKIKDQRELRGLIMAQANILPPPVKGMEFYEIINALLTTIDTVQPAPGTRPSEILKKHLREYINGPQATTHTSFASGNVLKDDNYAYFVYDEYYNDLKDNGWKKDASRTSYMIEQLFDDEDKLKPEFGKKKRFPGKNKKTGKPNPGVNGCAAIPLHIFDKEDDEIEEIVHFEKEEEIV